MRILLISLIILSFQLNANAQDTQTSFFKDTVGMNLKAQIVSKGKGQLTFYLPIGVSLAQTDSIIYIKGLKKKSTLYLDFTYGGKDKNELTISGSGCSVTYVGNKSVKVQLGAKSESFTLLISAMNKKDHHQQPLFSNFSCGGRKLNTTY